MRNLLRDTRDLLAAGRAGRFMIVGALLLVTDAAFYKRCGCDKEAVRRITGGPLTIAGRTFNFETGAGVPGVQLTFDGDANDYTVTTGANGSFSLTGVEPGDYQVKTWLTAFDERTRDLTLGASTSTFNIPLAPIHRGALDIKDTWVSLDDPTRNFSDMDYLMAGRKSGPGASAQAFLKINLPAGVPWGVKIHEARMTGYITNRQIFDPESPMTLCRVIEDFDPALINWTTRPEVVEEAVGTWLGTEGTGIPWVVTFDVKDVLEAYRDPDPRYPTFGVNLVTDSPAGARVGSSECVDPDCAGALSGTVDWSAVPPEFP